MPSTDASARLLWDHGGLWSLMAWEALVGLGLPIKPITAAEIQHNGLDGAGLLLAPGGWPSLKLAALGPMGTQAVREFVVRGGYYVGLCGGAGLALGVSDGMGMVPLDRAPHLRPPSLSGPVWCGPGEGCADHPMWRGQEEKPVFHVWFPGQFAEPEQPDIRVIARYKTPHPELCSADLVYGRTAAEKWSGLEESYGMRLDPSRLAGLPAVVEAKVGQGKALLSYLHWDTPGDQAGALVLKNLWRENLGLEPGKPFVLRPDRRGCLGGPALDLWRQGRDLGLWRARHAGMPLWRRGARGLEFWSLYRLCRAADALARELGREHGLEPTLAPIWRQGPEVLKEQAARLERGEMQPRPGGAEAEWFGTKRRVEGSLAQALAGLDNSLLKMVKALGSV